MSATSGPDIVSDSLVFYYDTGNSRDSYKGEPTTNLTTDTPTGNGWAGDFTVVDSATKTYTIESRQNNAATTSAWRTHFWSVSSYIGSYVTISADVEHVSETDCTFLSLSIGQGNTGQYPYHIAGSPVVDRVQITTKPTSKVHLTWSGVINSTGIVGFTQWINNVTANGANSVLRVSNVQIEAKDHETPFINGTRSSTQGLLDISGQGTSIDISNASFDSNAQMTFDGTDDKLHGIQTVHSYLSSSAIEFIVSPETSNKRMMVGGYRHNGGYSLPTIGSVYIDSDNKFKASVITATEVYRLVASSTTINANQTYHVIFNKNTSDGNMELYVNGILQSSQTFDSATYAQWTSAGSYIGSNNIDLGKSFNTNSGQGWSGDYLEGKIHIFKIHSRILTAAEVKQNYDSIKTRFGLI